MAIAVALVVIAVVVFGRGGHDLVLAPRGQQFAVTIPAVNSALFIVVVLELVRTIVAGWKEGLPEPFLVIGIISATRDIRTVGRNCHSSVNRRRWFAR